MHHWPSRLAQLYPVLKKLSLRGQELCAALMSTLNSMPGANNILGQGSWLSLRTASPSNARSPRQDNRPETTRPFLCLAFLCPSMCVPRESRGINWRGNPLSQHPEKEVAP